MKYLLIFLSVILVILIITLIIIKKLYVTDLYKSIDHQKKIIYFGQTLDLDIEISSNYSVGFQLAFQSNNRKGGINGYKLNIILYNDKYEPSASINNAKILIDYFNVLALIGSFGTPTTASILNDTIKSRPIPLIAPFTGSNIFRTDFNKYLILMNNSSEYEFKLYFENMKENNIQNVGIIYQNDIYGTSYYNSFVKDIIIKNINLNIISTGTYERNSVDLDKCYNSLFNINNPYDYVKVINSDTLKKMDAVILFVSEKQISRILGYLKRIKPKLFIYYNFFVGTLTTNYKDLEKYNKENIFQSLLTPIELNKDYPILYKKLKEEIEIYQKNNNATIHHSQSLYQGFYSGLLICEVLKRYQNFHNLTRENFIDTFYNIQDFDIYGLKIGPFINNKSNVGFNKAFLNKLVDNELKTIKTI
jgi:branched-chain amino acid transport system substrate-binding protein